MEPLLRVTSLVLAHPGQNAAALSEVSFEVHPGEVLAVVGPSGIGKSTLLGALAGVHRPRAGQITTRRGLLKGPTPRHALVFQDGALFPWLSLKQNILYALRRAPRTNAERESRARELLVRVRLAEHEAKYPHELSGGMKKRGAFARALASDPELLLLDEPFSAVDGATREELHALLRAAHGITTVLVTHDVEEAVALAGRALVLGGSPGRIVAEVDLSSRADARAHLARALSPVPVLRKEASDEADVADRSGAYRVGAHVVGAR